MGFGRLTRFSPAPHFGPARPGDVEHSVADIETARRDLGYAVQVGWEEGLSRTLEFYRL